MTFLINNKTMREMDMMCMCVMYMCKLCYAKKSMLSLCLSF